MNENHNSAKVRFNPRPIRSVFRRKSDAVAYLEYRGWKRKGDSIFDSIFESAFNDEQRIIINGGKNHWTIGR